jgi:hypothetical protein
MPQIVLPKLHEAQQRIVSEMRRYSVLACGRRFGKSTLGLNLALRAALEGQPVGWAAPSYRHLKPIFRECESILGTIVDSNRNDKTIEFPGGGILEFWSLDSASVARGRKYKLLIVDEAAHCPVLREQWEQALRPTLADLRGSAMFLSSPNGLNYFHTLWQRGQDDTREDWKSWQMPTSSNPFIPAEEIEAARQDQPELVFKQEFLAEFINFEGAVFRKIGDAIWDVPEELKRAQSVQPWMTWAPTFAIGCDWGRSGDYTVFTVVTDLPFRAAAGDIDGESTNQAWECCSVVEIDRFRGVEYAHQCLRLKALWERYGRPVVLAESNSIGQPVIEQLSRDGVRVRPFFTNNSSKAEIIDKLVLAFERGTIRIPNDPVLIGELTAFEATRLPTSGLTRYAAPTGQHDDLVISLALARHALSKYAGAYSHNPAHLQRRKDIALMTGSAVPI